MSLKNNKVESKNSPHPSLINSGFIVVLLLVGSLFAIPFIAVDTPTGAVTYNTPEGIDSCQTTEHTLKLGEKILVNDIPVKFLKFGKKSVLLQVGDTHAIKSRDFSKKVAINGGYVGASHGLLIHVDEIKKSKPKSNTNVKLEIKSCGDSIVYYNAIAAGYKQIQNCENIETVTFRIKETKTINGQPVTLTSVKRLKTPRGNIETIFKVGEKQKAFVDYTKSTSGISSAGHLQKIEVGSISGKGKKTTVEVKFKYCINQYTKEEVPLNPVIIKENPLTPVVDTNICTQDSDCFGRVCVDGTCVVPTAMPQPTIIRENPLTPVGEVQENIPSTSSVALANDNSPDICSDNDPNNNPRIYGSARGLGSNEVSYTLNDNCLGSRPDVIPIECGNGICEQVGTCSIANSCVYQAYCSGNNLNGYFFKCPSGTTCSNGACV